MCLTLGNAATIHHHTDPTGTAVRGYTSTSHHAGHLTPGDLWQPVPDQPPHGSSPTSTATTAASGCPTSRAAPVPTPPTRSSRPPVPDLLHIHTSTMANGGTR